MSVESAFLMTGIERTFEKDFWEKVVHESGASLSGPE
jgi:hypothetical protein